jgi:hypothetical protein
MSLGRRDWKHEGIAKVVRLGYLKTLSDARAAHFLFPNRYLDASRELTLPVLCRLQ